MINDFLLKRWFAVGKTIKPYIKTPAMFQKPKAILSQGTQNKALKVHKAEIRKIKNAPHRPPALSRSQNLLIDISSHQLANPQITFFFTFATKTPQCENFP